MTLKIFLAAIIWRRGRAINQEIVPLSVRGYYHDHHKKYAEAIKYFNCVNTYKDRI